VRWGFVHFGNGKKDYFDGGQARQSLFDDNVPGIEPAANISPSHGQEEISN
jgi:hypothetical protein